jgi:hypothetical protein
MPEIPEPIWSVWVSVRKKKEPYRTILMHVYSNLLRENIYQINPDEVYDKLRREGKLKINGKNKNIKIGTVRRTLYAVIYGKKLERDVDYLVTSGGRGRKNLKFVNTSSTRSAFQSLI